MFIILDYTTTTTKWKKTKNQNESGFIANIGIYFELYPNFIHRTAHSSIIGISIVYRYNSLYLYSLAVLW
jgi:hypothetical protein